MAKVVAVHRLALKKGVEGPIFEQFMQKELFPGLRVVIQVEKTISHGFTLADWATAEHLLLRSNQDDRDGNYSWMIVAQVDDEKMRSEEARAAIAAEVQAIAQEFFDLGTTQSSIAAVKLSPFATRTSFVTYLEVGQFQFGG
jgi:hypothetical protein